MAAEVERLTMSVPEAGKMLGLSKNAAYEGCKRGEIPSIRIGKRILVPKIQFFRLLQGENTQKVIENG